MSARLDELLQAVMTVAEIRTSLLSEGANVAASALIENLIAAPGRLDEFMLLQNSIRNVWQQGLFEASLQECLMQRISDASQHDRSSIVLSKFVVRMRIDALFDDDFVTGWIRELSRFDTEVVATSARLVLKEIMDRFTIEHSLSYTLLFLVQERSVKSGEWWKGTG